MMAANISSPRSRVRTGASCRSPTTSAPFPEAVAGPEAVARNAPRLAVVIPALNAAACLPATLAALRADWLALEIFVVDGGSSDDTAGIAERFGCRSLTSPA